MTAFRFLGDVAAETPKRCGDAGSALVRFFLLSRPSVNAPVEVASGSTLSDLPRTPMEEEFLRLYADERRAFSADGD